MSQMINCEVKHVKMMSHIIPVTVERLPVLSNILLEVFSVFAF